MISVVGLGPGSSDYITDIAKKTLETADLIFGYARHMEIIKSIDTNADKKEYIKLEELCSEISDLIKKENKIKEDTESEYKIKKYKEIEYEQRENKESKNEINIAVLASGDPSLYGIAKYLKSKFGEKNEFQIIPAISSLQYLFAKTSISMNDIYITSSHGKNPDIELIRKMKKTAMMTDKEKGPAFIADIFKDTPDDPYIIVGEMLGYEDECITIVKASKLDRNKDYNMSVVIIIKEELYEG